MKPSDAGTHQGPLHVTKASLCGRVVYNWRAKGIHASLNVDMYRASSLPIGGVRSGVYLDPACPTPSPRPPAQPAPPLPLEVPLGWCPEPNVRGDFDDVSAKKSLRNKVSHVERKARNKLA